MNESTNPATSNTCTSAKLSSISNSGKTPEMIVVEANAACARCYERGSEYVAWHNNTATQIANEGRLANWKDGLIISMQVCELSLVAQSKLDEAFRDCNELLCSHRAERERLVQTFSDTKAIDELIAECEATLHRIADGVTKESYRFDQMMRIWQQITHRMAHWYGLHPSVMWQTEQYMSPSVFEEAFEDEDLYGENEGD